MLEQLSAWQLLAVTIGVSVMAIPWVFGIGYAVKEAYLAYFRATLRLFGAEDDHWTNQPDVQEAATDGGRNPSRAGGDGR